MTNQPADPRGLAVWQREFLQRERLPEAYMAAANTYFDVLAQVLAAHASAHPGVFVLGVNGSQGSGKSTLCSYLGLALRHSHGLNVVSMSLDDFYRTQDERCRLAKEVHPLLATRGVPGTHDVDLLKQTLDSLEGTEGEVWVPRFDKARDDRCDRSRWTRICCPVDLVILEGWCLGARPQELSDLETPCNELERIEDEDGRWRRFVNQALAAEFAPLYAHIDFWVMLQAPGFEHVLRWRSEQEAKLRLSASGNSAGIMTEEQLERFVAHYERLTNSCLQNLPAEVDVLFRLDPERRIVGTRGI
ncbi:MAG: kinase [Congregibacter sp.]